MNGPFECGVLPLQHGSRAVGGRLRVGRRDFRDLLRDPRHLRPCGTRQVEGIGDQRSQFVAGQPEAGIGGEAVEEVIDPHAVAHLQRDGDRVFLDDLVGLLATHSPAHRRHQHLRGGQEGQVAIQFGGDHLGESP